MNVIHRQHHISTEGVTTSETEEVSRVGLSRALAILRIAFGVTFLWAFLDKTFALGFSTGAQFAEDGSRAGTDFMAQDAAWLNGGSPTEGFLTFGVPADNPFVASPQYSEIWDYGLRNPWRYSFDPATGDLWIADVGQSAWEEIDRLPAGSPAARTSGGTCSKGPTATRARRRPALCRPCTSTPTPPGDAW